MYTKNDPALEQGYRQHRRFRRKAAVFAFAVALLGGGLTAAMPAMEADGVSGSIVAFPGAEGGGSLATGGRGGEVVHVTNLNDSGAGSFRDAVSVSNRIVVFDVGGTIELKSDVVVQSNITIAGQTAPGGMGITLKNYKLGLGGENTIVRFVSSRPGERGTSADYDAWGGASGANCIVDHCSIGWANDEQWGLYSKNDYNTVQYSVIGPSNSFSYHSKGIHGFGVMLGRSNCTWHHNLIVHNVSRNFRGKVVGTDTAEFVNNVIYNWATQTAYGTLGHVNYVGNTLKKGVSTVGGHNYVSVGDSGTAPENYLIYLVNNRFLNIDDTQYSNFTDNNWAGMKYGNDKTEANTRSDTPFGIYSEDGTDISMVGNAESAEVAYDHVLTYAGAGISTDKRTPIDQQVAYETRTGTGTLTGARPYSEATDAQKTTIDKYSMETGVTFTYPSSYLTKEIVDTDGDAMPDEWEIARGLDPNSASSAETNGDYCGWGYTNIEYYLNDLTVNAFPEGVVTLSPEVAREPIVLEGELIQSLTLEDYSNGADWSIQQNLQQNDVVYGDREVTFTAIPDALLGAEWIRTACDSKSFADDLGVFTAGDDVTVYVGLDSRITDNVGAWLSDWTVIDETMTASNDVVYRIYKKDFSKGETVTLGTNGQSSGATHYTVAVTRQAAEITYLLGDVNNDTALTVHDLQAAKQGLIYGFVSDAALKAADIDGNGSVTASDIVRMCKYILRQSDTL